MELHKNISWEHAGNEYQIRIMFDANLINVVAFTNNYPANGFRYQVLLPKSSNVQNILSSGNFSNLIDNAKEDIKNNRWENLLSH